MVVSLRSPLLCVTLNAPFFRKRRMIQQIGLTQCCRLSSSCLPSPPSLLPLPFSPPPILHLPFSPPLPPLSSRCPLTLLRWFLYSVLLSFLSLFSLLFPRFSLGLSLFSFSHHFLFFIFSYSPFSFLLPFPSPLLNFHFPSFSYIFAFPSFCPRVLPTFPFPPHSPPLSSLFSPIPFPISYAPPPLSFPSQPPSPPPPHAPLVFPAPHPLPPPLSLPRPLLSCLFS